MFDKAIRCNKDELEFYKPMSLVALSYNSFYFNHMSFYEIRFEWVHMHILNIIVGPL